MADEKSKNLTGADGPDKDPVQPEAGGSPAPGKEQKAPEAAAPEKTVKEPEKATPEKAAKEPEKTAPQKEAKEPEKAAPAKEEKKPEIPKEQKAEAPEGKEAPNVSFYKERNVRMNQSIDKFDRRLKQLLSVSGVERGELARHLGVSVPTVSRWLNGISTPNVYQFREIAHFFGMRTQPGPARSFPPVSRIKDLTP